MQIGRCLLICNGEIYNTNELYKQMGIKQLTGSDCEIIAHLYLRHGLAKTVDMLEGVFAFVLYDQKTKQLHVARDLLGIRPLFIGSSEGTGIGGGNGDVTLAFASEAKSLLSLRGVCQFPPGTWWTGDLRTRSGGSGLEIAKHTSGIFRQDVRGARPVASGTAPNLDRLREVFHKAVRKRLILSERPVACLLSGGLDSTLVTAVLVREMRRIHGPSATVNTYSIGMKGSVDLKWAAVAAKYLRTKHHEICLTEKEFLDAVPDTVWHTESFDTTTIRASVGNFLVSRYIRDNSDDKVIFVGDVADELFASYRGFCKAPSPEAFAQANRDMLFDIHLFDVLRSDRTISGAGLEARVPFGDPELLIEVLTMAADAKMFSSGGDAKAATKASSSASAADDGKPPLKKKRTDSPPVMEKYVLRKAFEGYLPHDLLYRRKEAFSDGVSSEKSSWFQVLRDHVATMYTDEDLEKARRTRSGPEIPDKESLWYRDLYDKDFGQCMPLPVPRYWRHPFCDPKADPSARLLECY